MAERQTAPGERSLAVVIPAYNEERRILATVATIGAYLQERAYDAEILVVDDGSLDRTVQVVRGLLPRFPFLRVLSYKPNMGKGYAVRTGVMASSKKAVLFSDADLSTPISEIEALWPWLERGFQVVIGSRALKQSRILVRQGAVRERMGRTFNRILGMLGVHGIPDTQCGFKLFQRDAALAIFSKLRTYRFAFDVEVLLRARRLGYRMAQVPVQWSNSPDSRVRMVRDAARMLLDVLKIRRLV